MPGYQPFSQQKYSILYSIYTNSIVFYAITQHRLGILFYACNSLNDEILLTYTVAIETEFVIIA